MKNSPSRNGTAGADRITNEEWDATYLKPIPESGVLPVTFTRGFRVSEEIPARGGSANSDPSANSAASGTSANAANSGTSARSGSSAASGKSAEEVVLAAVPAVEVRADQDFRLAVFALARRLKAAPDLQNRPVGEMRVWTERSHREARSVLAGRTFTDVWTEFVAAWDRVRTAAGEDDPVTLAWRAIQDQALPNGAENYDDPRVGLLIALCRRLQSDAGGDCFFLSGERAGELLGVTQPTAAKWFGMLVADEVLTVVDAGGGFRGGRRMARSYRYLRGD